jgi:hypothetical protein
MQVRHGITSEQEDNRYTNVYRSPALMTASDFTLIRNRETNTETSVDCVHPLDDHSKFEAGYNGQISETDLDFFGSFVDTTGATRVDATRTNHFIYDAAIHAFYGTYARKFGAFGLLAGLRFEHAGIDTNPEYQDPFNLRAGNPRLVPEDIHSIEAGWQYKQDDTSYLATVYYRNRFHGITEVSRYIDSTTLLTTKENLGTSPAGGLELGANTRVRDRVALNFSANAYRNEIDASNLGFSARRSSFAWNAKLNATFDVAKTTLIQLNSNYTAKRLTPQGYRYPNAVANLGLRHNFADKKTAVVFTLSDVFNSLRERTHIDTPVLHQEITRHRSSRIAYIGLIYNFGKPTKKSKKDELQFDNAL